MTSPDRHAVRSTSGAVTVVPVTAPVELARVHARLLAPSFPPAELVSTGELTAAVRAGTTEVLVLREDGEPAAVAVGERSRSAPVVLLSYLAADASRRSAGLGGRLLDAAVERWVQRSGPCVVLAEVEDPAHHRGSAAHGDPAARLRFYARRGARALELPYFQPALRPGVPRVPHLLLVVLHAAPALVEGTALQGALVHRFLTELLTAAEGSLPGDPEGRALLAAVDPAGVVPTRALG